MTMSSFSKKRTPKNTKIQKTKMPKNTKKGKNPKIPKTPKSAKNSGVRPFKIGHLKNIDIRSGVRISG